MGKREPFWSPVSGPIVCLGSVVGLGFSYESTRGCIRSSYPDSPGRSSPSPRMELVIPETDPEIKEQEVVNVSRRELLRRRLLLDLPLHVSYSSWYHPPRL